MLIVQQKFESNMDKVSLTDILMIAAVVIAPLAAIQVQKWLEIFREERGRKLWVFKTLMATRAANVSPEHVQALNMIDLEFREKRYKPVTDAWKAYLDHLTSFPKEDETLQKRWDEKRIDRLATLLMKMGKSLGYEFDEVHVKKAFTRQRPMAKSKMKVCLCVAALLGFFTVILH